MNFKIDAKIKVETWFERDRAMVSVMNEDTDDILLEWWDEEVRELVEAGFLSPDDWERSAIEYAIHLGVLTPIE